MSEPAPQGFISFQSAQRPVAELLKDRLQARGIDCWVCYDPQAISPGQQYFQEILPAIDRSDAVVLLFSPEADRSPHVMREIEYAVSREKPILPVNVGKLDPFELPKVELEYFLRPYQFIEWLQDHDRTITLIADRIDTIVAGEVRPVPPVRTRVHVSPVARLRRVLPLLRPLHWPAAAAIAIGAVAAGAYHYDAEIAGPEGALGWAKPKFATTGQITTQTERLDLPSGRVGGATSDAGPIPGIDAVFDKRTDGKVYRSTGLSLIATGQLDGRDAIASWRPGARTLAVTKVESQHGARLSNDRAHSAYLPDRCVLVDTFYAGDPTYVGLFSVASGKLVALPYVFPDTDDTVSVLYRPKIDIRGDFVFATLGRYVGRIKLTGTACPPTRA